MGSVVNSVMDGIGLRTDSSDGAISQQTNSLADAQQYWNQAYDRQMEAVKPWQEAGIKGLAGLQNFNFEADPGYQFRLNQGLSGIDRAMAARGLGNSGRTLKALSNYNQDFASNEYQNAFNRDYQTNMGLANFGQNAYQNAANYAWMRGDANAQGKIGLGNANAAAIIGQGNKFSNMLGQGAQAGAAYFGMKSPSGGG